MTTGLQEALHCLNILKELGYDDVSVTLRSDSLGAKQAAERPGALHLKHMALRWHYLKEAVQCGPCNIEKIPSAGNAADMLTKTLSGPQLARCLEQMKAFFRDR